MDKLTELRDAIDRVFHIEGACFDDSIRIARMEEVCGKYKRFSEALALMWSAMREAKKEN